MRIWRSLCIFLTLVWLAGCTPSPTTTTPIAPATLGVPSPVILPTASHTALPSITATLTLAPAPSFTPTPQWIVSSPLEGVPINELASIIAGDTYQPPQPGRDDGHAGVDFAYYRRGTHTTIQGLPVYAALSGRVAAVIDNKMPYGNMVMIETSLTTIPANFHTRLALPTPLPTVIPDPRLTCPTPAKPPVWSKANLSLYVVYAHLNQASPLKLGQTVNSGALVGEVGTTGRSVNPHLHFEVRLGPANASFDSLGHYDSKLTPAELANYCLWRVSGWFQPIDPMLLFK